MPAIGGRSFAPRLLKVGANLGSIQRQRVCNQKLRGQLCMNTGRFGLYLIHIQ